MGAMTFLAAAILVALDQLTKGWARAAFEGNEAAHLGLGFSFTYVRNTGAAFGMLRRLDLPLGPVTVDGTFLLGLLSLAVSIWLVVHLVRHRHESGSLARIALTMVLAGAVGNMIDRFRLGYVIDFVHFRVGWFDFPVFNLADALVVGGAALLLLATLAKPDTPARDGRGVGRTSDRGGDGEPWPPREPAPHDPPEAS